MARTIKNAAAAAKPPDHEGLKRATQRRGFCKTGFEFYG
jgi:hypothetical protein